LFLLGMMSADLLKYTIIDRNNQCSQMKSDTLIEKTLFTMP
jgi:hypothetical protein